MTHPDAHAGARLDDWLDDRLTPEERQLVERHLAECRECRALAAALAAGRRELRTALAAEPPPPGLETRIAAALDLEDEAGAAAGRSEPADGEPTAWGSRLTHGLLPLAAGLALVALALFLLLRDRAPAPPTVATTPTPAPAPAPEPAPVSEDAVSAALAQYRALPAQLPPGLAAAGPAEIEARWQRAGIAFAARVLDLSAMGIEVAGGDATELAGAPAARSLYRGAGEGWLTCWMYRGEEADLPAPDEVRSDHGFEFRVFRRGEETLVVWREGEVLCVLAGRGDPETVIQLAFAKAMAPAAAAGERT